VAAGHVLVGGAPAEKVARLVSPAEAIVVGEPARFVGRGGQKLAAALDVFAVEVVARRALDAGASTGGFTDCLLQHGASEVVAVDVGRAQLHERLRADPRVRVLDRTNIRTLEPASVEGGPFPLVVADLSFISLVTVAGALLRLTSVGGDMVLLVKPQFEAGRQVVSRGRGVVRDPVVWGQVIERVGCAMEDAGAVMMGVMVSPLRGADGNVEFLAHVRAHQPSEQTPLTDRIDLPALLARATPGATPGATRRATERQPGW
jgi:23S rRNA (cytidine1920-2'-O)/16S rRNA (cytidine1409-2'-O)-methyltransferase